MARVNVLVFTLSAVFTGVISVQDAMREELLIRPLESGHIYSHFEFKTHWNASYDDSGFFEHFRLFPKPLGEVLKTWGVEEFHLSQTHGLWRWDKWGYPIQNAPPGAELWVWFHKDTVDVDEAWKNLINILSGMFCASLNFMDAGNTVSPKWSFRPEGLSSHGGFKGFLRYAALPREMVCTENLTPWKKLLPCAARSGLGVLLNAMKVYDASFSSLGIHYRSVCKDNSASLECTETAVEMKQTLSVVQEPLISSKSQDWSLKRLFNRMVISVCPLADTTVIYVDQSLNKNEEYFFTLSPEPHSVETLKSADGKPGKLAVYDVAELTGHNRVLNIAAKYNKNLEYKESKTPMIYAHQYQTGYGQERGGVLCLIYNNHAAKSVAVMYMQTLPWYLRMYIHTLTIDHFTVGSHMSIGAQGNSTTPKFMNYVPGRDHQQPYFLELGLMLPPNTVTRLSFQYERALLKWTEYPPDANHGFYVNSAVITTPLTPDWDVPVITEENSKTKSMFSRFSSLSVLRVHTEHLLVTLPTPDFSMPYNVICLACTVVAIAFGSIHNLTTRRFIAQDPAKNKGLLSKIKSFVFKDKSSKDEKITEPKIDEKKSNDKKVVDAVKGDTKSPGGSTKKSKKAKES